MSDEIIRKLQDYESRIARLETLEFIQGGGVWHLIRDPDNGWWAAAIAVNAGAFHTSANVLGVRQVPLDAKGVIMSCALRSATEGASMNVCEGTRNPNDAADMPLGQIQFANQIARQWVAVLFGITAGVPDGTIRFGAFTQNCDLWYSPIGYIA